MEYTVEVDATPLLDQLVGLGLVEEGEPAKGRKARDPGSWIGNQAWNGVRGDPISGTHFGKLNPEARERRREKAARHRSNRITRGEENKRRGSRA